MSQNYNPEKTNNLLASVALFSNLYNDSSSRNIGDILAEFIKAAVVENNKWSTTANDMRTLLETMFGFEIPEAVIKNVLRNKLKGIVKNKNGYFHFDQSAFKPQPIEKEYISLKVIHSEIFEKLVEYVQYNIPPLSDEEKFELQTNFYKFLMDNGISDSFSDKISAFILSNSKDAYFSASLNLIREGLILYQGIKHSADLNILGVWNTNLTIYLSPEHLFSALGYNGTVYQEIFNDFYELVREINTNNKNRNNENRINLRYFEETIDEVISLFTIAQSILKGQAELTTHRPAMHYILNNVKDPSEIVEKRVQFTLGLKQMGILLQEFNNENQYKYADYNVEDRNIIEAVRKESIKRSGRFDEKECQQLLKIFTRINYFRGGRSNDKFENIGYLYVTESGLALHLAHNNRVKFGERDIPFAKSLEYITSKFWFKLQKGFGNDHDFPKSFDVVTKAQIILSTHANNAILNKYDKLKKDISKGTATVESMSELNAILRENLTQPEDITYESVDKSLNFIESENFFEEYIREKQRKDRELLESNRRIKELEVIVEDNLKKEREKQEEETRELEQLKKDEFVYSQWRNLVKENNWLSVRTGVVILLTSIPILGTLLKLSDVFKEQSKWSGNTKVFFGISILIYIIEFLGRSYFFDKAKILMGWKWIIMRITNKKHDYKLAKIAEFEIIYNNSNSHSSTTN